MKILFMGVRDDERPAAEAWMAAHPEHEVTLSTSVLTLDTVDEVEGFDALTLQQVVSPEPEVYARLEKHGIRQLSSRTAGVDMFDLALAQQHGIVVSNVPVYSPNAIAEFALASALHITRRFGPIAEKMASHDFRFAGLIGRELATLRVAVLGTGSIGLRTARLFHALGATVVGYDPYPRPDFDEVGTYAASVEEAVDGADILTLHMPALADNHHMIDASVLARLAPQAIVINAARGAILDARALLDAIRSGHLMGAALDTYEGEAPYYRSDWTGRELEDPLFAELLAEPAVLMTPHVAFYSETAVKNLVTGGLDNAVAVVETGTCGSIMSPA